ncbi:hypothetical protein BDV95DRAFT_504089, partial [Massariosphaeria phaeospora]
QEIMDGKNSSGRRISLLNDNPAPFQPAAPSLRSRTSSYTSFASSPPTPRLVRSDSSDSYTMQTPSPITPEFSFGGPSMHSPVFSSGYFSSLAKDSDSAYPPVPQNSASLPYPATGASQTAYFSPQQGTGTDSRPASASANPRSKKNNYPCPMAVQFKCADYFTTSGHAARHAKKHTGKKDAFCPECNKAFTRKDNMEQHRRTHQSGRNATKGGEGSAKKAKHQAKRPKPAPLHTPMEPFPSSPLGSSMSIAPAVQPVDDFNDYSQSVYPDPAAFGISYPFSGGSFYGLDTLATAASEEKRKYGS